MNHRVLMMIALVLLVAGCQGHQQAESTAEHAQHAEPAQQAPAATQPATPVKVTDQAAELGCAHCIFHTPGVESCQPAIKLNDRVLKLEGPEAVMAPFGNMRLCSASVMAHVDGEVHGDAFVAADIRVDP
jgi:hypothetical protein